MTRDVFFLCDSLASDQGTCQKAHPEAAINLVVVPCNVDIATTEALSMAQEVDPDGDRTIGKKKGPSF